MRRDICWKNYVIAMGVVVWALGAWGCGPEYACGEFPLDDEVRECMVNEIDLMVKETFPFADYKEVDLDEFSKRLRATLEAESDDAVFVGELSQVVSTLRDGHTRIEYRTLEAPAVAPVDVEEVDGQLVIRGVDEERWQHLVGQRVRAIDGVVTEKALHDSRRGMETGVSGEARMSGPALMLGGEVGSVVRLTMEDGGEVELDRRSAFSEPEVIHVGEYGYLKLETFGFIDDLERIDDALNEVQDAKGLIIDLRGNGGGYPSVTDGLFGRLMSEEVEPFRLVDRQGELYRKLYAPPRGEIFEGPVAVLVDRRTYSASNYFAHRMVHHQRGVLIGDQTGGGAASPQRGAMLVPGVWFQVSTHVLMPPQGPHTESGIKPTVAVDVNAPSRGLIDERISTLSSSSSPDPVLERALRYLEGLR